MVVSHDRKLVNLLDTVCELSKRGITVYGGNYDFYAAQKQIRKHWLWFRTMNIFWNGST